MKDDTFELLTKMYAEFSEFRKDMNEFGKETNNRLDNLEVGQSKLEITLEYGVKDKLQVVYESEVANTERLEEHSKRLDTIENKLDYLALSVNSQDKRLEVVELSRKRKAK